MRNFFGDAADIIDSIGNATSTTLLGIFGKPQNINPYLYPPYPYGAPGYAAAPPTASPFGGNNTLIFAGLALVAILLVSSSRR